MEIKVRTWNNSSKLVHIAVDQAILKRSPAHTGNTDENQGFPAEWRHSSDLLVE